MVATTPISSLPYPQSNDIPDVDDHLMDLAVAIDTLTVPRFSSSSTRATGIPTPTNGQLAVLQDREQLTVYKTGYANWTYVDWPRQRKMKSADENVSSSTTMQDDNHLTGFSYKASTWYIVKGVFMCHGTTTADIKFVFDFTSAPDTNNSFVIYIINQPTTGGAEAKSTIISNAIQVPTQTTAQPQHVKITGAFLSISSGTMKLQWAQNASDATATRMYRGSWLEITEAN